MPDEAALIDARYRVAPGVVVQEFPTETVLLNLETGRFHGLNPTAATIVHLVIDGLPPRAAAERIAADTDHPLEQVRADLATLVGQLLERRLMVSDE
jgi:hypothetical protein